MFADIRNAGPDGIWHRDFRPTHVVLESAGRRWRHRGGSYCSVLLSDLSARHGVVVFLVQKCAVVWSVLSAPAGPVSISDVQATNSTEWIPGETMSTEVVGDGFAFSGHLASICDCLCWTCHRIRSLVSFGNSFLQVVVDRHSARRVPSCGQSASRASGKALGNNANSRTNLQGDTSGQRTLCSVWIHTRVSCRLENTGIACTFFEHGSEASRPGFAAQNR